MTYLHFSSVTSLHTSRSTGEHTCKPTIIFKKFFLQNYASSKQISKPTSVWTVLHFSIGSCLQLSTGSTVHSSTSSVVHTLMMMVMMMTITFPTIKNSSCILYSFQQLIPLSLSFSLQCEILIFSVSDLQQQRTNLAIWWRWNKVLSMVIPCRQIWVEGFSMNARKNQTNATNVIMQLSIPVIWGHI